MNSTKEPFNDSSQNKIQSITVIFERLIANLGLLERLEKTMNELGVEIHHIYKTSDAPYAAGEALVILPLVWSSEALLTLRTSAGYKLENNNYLIYGVMSAYEAARAKQIPIIDNNVDIWKDLTPHEFKQMCQSIISQLEFSPEIYQKLDLRNKGISIDISQLQKKSNSVLVIFDFATDTKACLNRLESTFAKLGWEVDHVYNYENEVRTKGWIPVMQELIKQTKYIIALRTEDSYRHRGLSGSKTGITLEYDLAKIYGVPTINMFQSDFKEWDDISFEIVCKGSIENLLHIEKAYEGKKAHERNRFWD